MIIPIRCFTCGQILASKYKTYCSNIEKIKESNIMDLTDNTDVYKKEMEKIGIKRYCCKKQFLGQINILEKLKSQ